MSSPPTMSPDFNLGDLAILQHSVFHPEYNGALGEIVAPERWRGSLTPARRPRPRQRLYRVRVIMPSDGEVVFSVARYQLRPLAGVAYERTGSLADTANRFGGARRPCADHDPDNHGPGARGTRGAGA